MNSNGKNTGITLLTDNQEIILLGSINNLNKYTYSNSTIKCDCINIFHMGVFWVSQYSNYKAIIRHMRKREDNHKHIVITLLVADELKLITIMETMSIGLLEAVCLLHIENKVVDWQSYN